MLENHIAIQATALRGKPINKGRAIKATSPFGFSKRLALL